MVFVRCVRMTRRSFPLLEYDIHYYLKPSCQGHGSVIFLSAPARPCSRTALYAHVSLLSVRIHYFLRFGLPFRVLARGHQNRIAPTHAAPGKELSRTAAVARPALLPAPNGLTPFPALRRQGVRKLFLKTDEWLSFSINAPLTGIPALTCRTRSPAPAKRPAISRVETPPGARQVHGHSAILQKTVSAKPGGRHARSCLRP